MPTADRLAATRALGVMLDKGHPRKLFLEPGGGAWLPSEDDSEMLVDRLGNTMPLAAYDERKDAERQAREETFRPRGRRPRGAVQVPGPAAPEGHARTGAGD